MTRLADLPAPWVGLATGEAAPRAAKLAPRPTAAQQGRASMALVVEGRVAEGC